MLVVVAVPVMSLLVDRAEQHQVMEILEARMVLQVSAVLAVMLEDSRMVAELVVIHPAHLAAVVMVAQIVQEFLVLQVELFFLGHKFHLRLPYSF
jgi:hypothetical protein